MRGALLYESGEPLLVQHRKPKFTLLFESYKRGRVISKARKPKRRGRGFGPSKNISIEVTGR